MCSVPAGGAADEDEEVDWLPDGLLLEQAPSRATGTTSKAAAVTVGDFDMASCVPGIGVIKHGISTATTAVLVRLRVRYISLGPLPIYSALSTRDSKRGRRYDGNDDWSAATAGASAAQRR